MATITRSHTNNLTVPKGQVFIQPAGSDAQRYIGANDSATLTIESEDLDYISAEAGIGEIESSAVVSVDRTLALIVSDISDENLSIFISGGIASLSQTGASVTDEEISLQADRDFQLGASTANPTGVRSLDTGVAVTINHKAGEAASAWVTLTAYAVGDVVIPTTPNAHAYKCLVAGTTAGPEPTWPIDGTTVVDATVTWGDVGKITLVEGTDFTTDSASARFNIGPASLVFQHDSVADIYNVDYTTTTVSREQISTGSAVSVVAAITVKANNAKGDNKDWFMGKCTLKPAGDFLMKGQDAAWQNVTFEVTVGTPDDGTASIYIDGVAA